MCLTNRTIFLLDMTIKKAHNSPYTFSFHYTCHIGLKQTLMSKKILCFQLRTIADSSKDLNHQWMLWFFSFFFGGGGKKNPHTHARTHWKTYFTQWIKDGAIIFWLSSCNSIWAWVCVTSTTYCLMLMDQTF